MNDKKTLPLLAFDDPRLDVHIDDMVAPPNAYDDLSRLKECQFTRSYAGIRAIRSAILVLEGLGEGRRYECRRDQYGGIVVTRRSTTIGIYPPDKQK